MTRYKVGDTVVLNGRWGKIVWLCENPNEFESMDEYIVEFDNNEKRFFVASSFERTCHRPAA